MEDVTKEIKKDTIKAIDPFQLLLNIISLCVFPFIARPMFQMVTGVEKKLVDKILEQRKKEVPKFIIDAIKK